MSANILKRNDHAEQPGMYLPDYSIGAEGLRLDYVSEPVDVFLYVKHRQRHGASEPYRRMGKVYAWTCQKSNTDTGDQ